MEAQSSGQAISGASDNAIFDGFAGNAALINGNESGVNFNFAAEPQQLQPTTQTQKTFEERAGYAFAGLGYAGEPVLKAPPRAAPKEWLGWADVRGIGWNTNQQTGDIRGGQTNGLLGLSRKLAPDFLVGVFGSW